MLDQTSFDRAVAGNTLTLTCKDADAFKNGTDIDIKTIKKVEAYRNEYIEKATNIAQEKATEELKKNKNIERVVVEFPFTTNARGHCNVVVDREKTFHVPGEKDENKTITRPNITVSVKDPSSKMSKTKIKELQAKTQAALANLKI